MLLTVGLGPPDVKCMDRMLSMRAGHHTVSALRWPFGQSHRLSPKGERVLLPGQCPLAASNVGCGIGRIRVSVTESPATYLTGGLTSFTIAPCSSLMMSSENLSTASSWLVLSDA